MLLSPSHLKFIFYDFWINIFAHIRLLCSSDAVKINDNLMSYENSIVHSLHANFRHALNDWSLISPAILAMRLIDNLTFKFCQLCMREAKKNYDNRNFKKSTSEREVKTLSSYIQKRQISWMGLASERRKIFILLPSS